MASVYKMWRLTIFLLFVSYSHAKGKPNLIQLNEETWKDLLEGEWLVKFYAPWCPACKALGPVWDSVAGWSEDLEIKVAKIDVTENPGLSGRFLVTSLPTVYHVKDGQFRMYRGQRAENDIISFVDDNKWEEVEPVPWYTSPTSIHMGALGMFFKASMSIRDLHDKMTSDYGIPVWGSYTIFAVATIILGLLLGLLIVFLCDVMLPGSPPDTAYAHAAPRSSGFRPKPRTDEDDKDSDIIDDLPPKPQPQSSPKSPRAQPTASSSASAATQEDGNRSQEEDEEGSEDAEKSQDEGSQAELSGDDQPIGGDTDNLEGAVGGDVVRPERPKTARRRKLEKRTD